MSEEIPIELLAETATGDPFDEPMSDSLPHDLKPLSEEEVEAILEAEIADSITYRSSEIASEQTNALRYYFGRPFGNEIKGRSQVILTDVRDTIEWILPTLLRIFFGGRQVVRYMPRGPEDVEAAKQATDYAQYLTKGGSIGFLSFHDWFKDALLEKLGAGIIYYEEKIERELQRYRGLSEEELLELASRDESGEIEIVAFNEKTEEKIIADPQTGEPIPIPVTEYDVDVREMRPRGRIKFDGIPQEEFLLARRAREIDDDVAFIGRKVRRRYSDLVAMGFDPRLIESLPSGTGNEFSEQEQERRQEEDTSPDYTADRLDWASRETWLVEAYIHIDEDGDGYAERRRILAAGDSSLKILEDDEVTHIPIATLCPVPIPHKVYGLSIADLLMDLQLIRSTLLRQMMDNIYLQNNSRQEVVEGEVEIEDLLTSTPGGLVRVTQPGMINPIVTQPLGPGAFNLLEYLHGVKEDRTGITRYNQGRDADTLNQTARGVTAIMEAANIRIEMLARIFGETGVKRLYEQLLWVMRESPVKDEVIRLRGEWVNIERSIWDTNLDVEVEVGLGTSQMASRVENMILLRKLQMEALNEDPRMVTPENVYEVLQRIPEAMGFNTDGLFFTEPQGKLPPKAPDPKVLQVQQAAKEAEGKLQLERETLVFRKHQLDMEAQLKREEMQTRITVAQIQSASSVVIAKQKRKNRSNGKGREASQEE